VVPKKSSFNHSVALQKQHQNKTIPCSAEEARRKTPSVANKIWKNPKNRWLSPY